MSEKKLIYIIEDNLPVRKLLSTLLKRDGFETESFGNGTDAIEKIKDQKPDIVLIDILLPDMNGIELLERIKDLSNIDNTCFIAVTGYASVSDKDKFLNAGFSGYISKPVNTSTFANEINNIVNS